LYYICNLEENQVSCERIPFIVEYKRDECSV
jgi:hypothetical protein